MVQIRMMAKSLVVTRVAVLSLTLDVAARRLFFRRQLVHVRALALQGLGGTCLLLDPRGR